MVSVRNLHFSEIEGVGTKSKAESSKKTIEYNHSSGVSFKEGLKQFTKGKISYIPENIKPWERPLKNVHFCSSSRKGKILTTPVRSADLRGRQEYIEYFED